MVFLQLLGIFTINLLVCNEAAIVIYKSIIFEITNEDLNAILHHMFQHKPNYINQVKFRDETPNEFVDLTKNRLTELANRNENNDETVSQDFLGALESAANVIDNLNHDIRRRKGDTDKKHNPRNKRNTTIKDNKDLKHNYTDRSEHETNQVGIKTKTHKDGKVTGKNQLLKVPGLKKEKPVTANKRLFTLQNENMPQNTTEVKISKVQENSTEPNPLHRVKRNLNNNISNNTTKINENNKKTTESRNVTDDNSSSESKFNETGHLDASRRSMNVKLDGIKEKLLAYIEENFNDFRNKIESVKRVKKSFSDSYAYTIGYIVANIDTLEVNLLNLENDISSNSNHWSEYQILEMLDKVKSANTVMTSLVNLLESTVDKELSAHQLG